MLLSFLHVFSQLNSSFRYFFFFSRFFKKCVFCLFLAALGLHCSTGLSLVADSGGFSLVVEHRHLRVVTPLLLSSRLMGFSSCGSRDLQHRPSSCGVWAELLRSTWNLPRPGIKSCPLHWQADFYPLGHREIPIAHFF